MDISTRQATDSAHDLENLFARYEPLHIRYEPDELICQVGSYAAGVYLVTAGLVQESYVDPESRESEISIGLLGRGALIGLEFEAPTGESLHRTTCRAVSRVLLSFLEKGAFAAAVGADEGLRQYVVSHLAERCLGLAHALWRSRLDVEARLSRLLLDLAPLGDPTRNGEIALPREITVRLLAALAHASPRQARQTVASLPGVSRHEERLTFSPEELRPQS